MTYDVANSGVCPESSPHEAGVILKPYSSTSGTAHRTLRRFCMSEREVLTFTSLGKYRGCEVVVTDFGVDDTASEYPREL